MSTAYQRIAELLARYLSSVNAESILTRALREAQVDASTMTMDDIERLVPKIEHGIRLFVAPDRQARIRVELGELRKSTALVTPETMLVRVEGDISLARMRARDLCESLRARAVTSQKVATIVSELARNIVNYTPGGKIELALIPGAIRKLRIVAVDGGPGIANLEEIMAGRYRSRTGLGKGLLGVKRLSDQFDVKTDGKGTRVDVVVSV